MNLPNSVRNIARPTDGSSSGEPEQPTSGPELASATPDDVAGAPPSTGMLPRIQAIALHVVHRLAEVGVEDVQSRYNLGCVAHQIRYDSSGQFARCALAEFADAVHLSVNVLRRYARVSETIGAHELAEFLAWRTRCGLPLTWSHLERLSEVRGKGARRRWAEEAIREALSVRELERRLRRLRCSRRSRGVHGRGQLGSTGDD
jgi:hypothetical protein